MRKNDYTSIEEFTSQYTGIWAPSEGHWYGLDFIYEGQEYRFNTGAMYADVNTILPDGREAVFGLYKKASSPKALHKYALLAEFATMEEALNSTCIGGVMFRKIIIDDNTELVGQD